MPRVHSNENGGGWLVLAGFVGGAQTVRVGRTQWKKGGNIT